MIRFERGGDEEVFVNLQPNLLPFTEDDLERELAPGVEAYLDSEGNISGLLLKGLRTSP